MKAHSVHRGVWLATTVALVAALLWLDQNRGGPASLLSRCNLLLTRSELPAADVLIIGSSRTGTALDPIAMQEMLGHAMGDVSPAVERIALGHSPLRAGLGLLENYLERRGAPKVIALELMFLTRRSVDKLAQGGINSAPERYIFRRDLNLMTFDQILRLPAVAMPFSEREGFVNRWRFRLRGVVLRAGALIYQAFRLDNSWELSACDRGAWTHEPTWPADFAFSHGDFEPGGPPRDVIKDLEAVLAETAPARRLKAWQSGIRQGERYPYDFDEPYRRGELALLEAMLRLASDHGVPTVLLPLPLYGYAISADDLRFLSETLPEHAHVFDLYGHVRGDLSKFWYDDGHIEANPAGALTTAILAQHLLQTGLLPGSATMSRHD